MASKKLLTRAILTTLLSLTGAFSAAAQTPDIHKVLSTPLTANSKILSALEKRFDAVDANTKVVILDPDRLTAAAKLINRPSHAESLMEVTRLYLEDHGLKGLPENLIARLALSTGRNVTPSNQYLRVSKGLPGIRYICPVIPANAKTSQKDFMANVINSTPNKSRYGMDLKVTLADGEMQSQSNAHETFHCLDNIYGPRLGGMSDEEFFSPEGLVLQQKEEVFGDVGGVGEAMLAGYKNVAQHTADMRRVHTAMAGPYNAPHIAPAIMAFDKKIKEIGLETYRGMSLDERRTLIYELTEEFSLTAKQLDLMGHYHTQGPSYLKQLAGKEASLMNSYIHEAKAAYERLFGPDTPIKKPAPTLQ